MMWCIVHDLACAWAEKKIYITIIERFNTRTERGHVQGKTVSNT